MTSTGLDFLFFAFNTALRFHGIDYPQNIGWLTGKNRQGKPRGLQIEEEVLTIESNGGVHLKTNP